MDKILFIVPPNNKYEDFVNPPINVKRVSKKSGSFGAVITDMPLIPLDDIINLRNIHSLCIKCQKYSLHRYFDPIYYSDYIKNLLNSFEVV